MRRFDYDPFDSVLAGRRRLPRERGRQRLGLTPSIGPWTRRRGIGGCSVNASNAVASLDAAKFNPFAGRLSGLNILGIPILSARQARTVATGMLHLLLPDSLSAPSRTGPLDTLRPQES